MNICRLCLGEGIGYPSMYTEKSYVHRLVKQMETVVGLEVSPVIEQKCIWTG